MSKLALLVTWAAAFYATASFAAPRHVYLTWQGDTSTTMTVNFQTPARSEQPAVFFSKIPDTDGPAQTRVAARSHQVPGLPDGRWIHVAELTELEPGATYRFTAGDDTDGFSAWQKFQTIPAGDQPLRFVNGGDMGTGHVVETLLAQAAKCRPQFALLGGDHAYENGSFARIGQVDAWLDHWQKHMVTPNDLRVPMVLAVGNHEVAGGYGGTPEKAPFHYGFFAQNGNVGYFTRTFGSLVALHILDTGHSAPYDGAQKAWLEAELETYRKWPCRFAAYHVPLFPARRPLNAPESRAGRLHWLPLFDRYALTTAFEHHDHAFKRTRRLLDGQPVAQGGTLYLGDGCFGQRSQPLDEIARPYLAKRASIEHFWLVEVSREGAVYRALDQLGRTFDVYPEAASGAAEAEKVFATIPKKIAIPKTPLSPPDNDL